MKDHAKMLWKSAKIVAVPFIAMTLIFGLWCAAMTYSQYAYERRSAVDQNIAKLKMAEEVLRMEEGN